MLVINPDERWGSKKVLWRLKQVLNQKSNPKEYYCPARARGTFHPSPLLRPWDESSYDQRLLFHLNDKPELVTYSGLKCSADLAISALPDPLKQHIELFDHTFLPQSSFSVHVPSRSPTTTTTGTDTASEDQGDTASETSSRSNDPNSREVSVDLTRGTCPEYTLQLLSQFETTMRTPNVSGEASNVSSIQVSTDHIQHDTSQDAQFLRSPSRSHGPLSSKATSIFTRDRRRSVSSCTGQSTLDPNDLSERTQSDGEDCAAELETQATGDRGADDNLQIADGGESSHKVEMAPTGSSPKTESAVQRTWASFRRRFKAVWKPSGQFVRRKSENMPS